MHIYKSYTRGTMKCPKNYVKDVFFTWDHMHFILKCLEIEHFHFRLIFHFQTSHVLFLWNAPIFMFEFSEMPHFSFLILKMGKWGISKNSNIKNRGISKKNTWLVWKMSRKWKSSILGHFKIKCMWPHVKNTSFTCFLGHFMIPRVVSFSI